MAYVVGKREMLSRDAVLAANEGCNVDGYVLIQSYNSFPQKNGGNYFSGNLQCKGQIPFKVWFNPKEGSAYNIFLEGIEGKVCWIMGKINDYNGARSLIIDSVEVAPDDADLIADDFLENIYNADAYAQSLRGTLVKNCSENAVKVFDIIFEDVKDRFMLEFAAVGHHDSVKSGLLAHSTKVTKICLILKYYQTIIDAVGMDVILVGAALHDVGKILEYRTGSVTEVGQMLSHLTMGILILERHKEEIVKLCGNDFYISLLSVISQHHGEFGDRPRSIAAYVISKIDSLEADFTSLNDAIKDANGIAPIRYNNLYLS